MSDRPGPLRACWLVGAVALVIRLAAQWETRGVPLVWHPIGDAAGYREWALRIAGGEWLGSEPFYQAPLYPYLLAVCTRVFGPDIWIVRLVQAVGGAAACALLCYAAWRCVGRRAAVVSGLMLALYPPAIFADGIIQKTSLTVLLVCGVLAACARAAGASSATCMALVGLLSGLLVLARENAMVWLPILGAWCLVGRRSVVDAPDEGLSNHCSRSSGTLRVARTVAFAAFVVGASVPLGVVGARNRWVGGEWSVSTFQAGPNLYIGNHRGADGRYVPLVRGHEEPAFERADAAMLAERAMGRRLSAREVSDYWMARALAEIRADPVSWLRLTARKLAMVWNAYEVSDVENQYLFAESSLVLRVLEKVWHFGVLCPLAAVGVVATWGRWRELWPWYALIVSMALAVAAFFVLARYRMPLVPLLMPFAAAGCVWLLRVVRARAGPAGLAAKDSQAGKCRVDGPTRSGEAIPQVRRTWGTQAAGQGARVAAAVAAAVVVAVAVNWPIHDRQRLNALSWMNVGVALARDGNVAEAMPYFRRAVWDFPESAEANNNLAQALAVQGDFAGAIPHYEAALRAEPKLMGVHYNLGVALERVGRVAEARESYRRALEQDPADEEARRALERMER